MKFFVRTFDLPKSLLSGCLSSTEQGCAQNKQYDFQSNLASFRILRDKRAFLADGLLQMWPIVKYTSFWHLWWFLIGIICRWLSFTTFVNADSSSVSPYLTIAGRPPWTLLNLSSLDVSGRLQITHTSADIVIGWNLILCYPFRESNYLNI